MTRFCRLSFAHRAMLLLWLAGPAMGITLVKDGKPQATIIVSKAAMKPAKDDPAARKLPPPPAIFRNTFARSRRNTSAGRR